MVITDGRTTIVDLAIGMRGDATHGRDSRVDWMAPPRPPGDYLHTYIALGGGSLWKDYRAITSDSIQYGIYIDPSEEVGGPVTIRWDHTVDLASLGSFRLSGEGVDIDMSAVDSVQLATQPNVDLYLFIDVVRTASSASLFSDTFSTTTLDSRWRFYDPVGDVSLLLTGSNANIDIPAGANHDLWTGNNNLAPRLLQPAPDTDFGIEAKFETIPAEQYQIQGLVVQESDSKLIRMGAYHTGSALLAFAAFIDGNSESVFLNSAPTGGITPSHFRVERTGNDWTYSYSVDGTTWTVATTFTQALAVTEVGFYGGNAGPNPAFVSSADYFMDLANPVTDTDGLADNAVPSFTSTPVITATEGQDYTYSVAATDTDSDPLQITGPTVPAWLTLTDTGSGRAMLSGTPGAGDVGSHAVVLTVSDGTVAVQQSFIVTVNPAGSSSLFTDAFSSTTLDSRWRFYDPVGDVTLSLTGTHAQMDIPAGVSHDLWAGSANDAPRLLQPAADTDFGIEVKFDSTPSEQYQIQGLVVQETDGKLLRMGAYHTGSALLMFAAFIDGGSSTIYHNTAPSGGITPSYLRAERTGNDWTYSYSEDGDTWTVATTFTQTLAVNEVGFYGGNAGPNPAFVSSADYFMDLANPITGLFSDTFTSPTLDSRWRFYDPVGDVSLSLSGANATVDIPGGVSHDLWTGSSNHAPRLLQSAPDADFGVEAKFESTPEQQYQIQGLVVQEDSVKLLRMGTYHTGAALLLFAAFIDGGSSTIYHNTAPAGGIAPSHLRVERSGNDWTYSYSADGATWVVATTFTQALAVTEVGFYGGNAGPNPAFVASTDYFMDLANPVIDTDGSGGNTTPAFTSTPVTSVTEDQVYTYSVTATDADGDPLQITGPTLPAWLTLTDNGNGTASLSGTPSATEVGSHAVVLALSDGTATVQQSFTIAVNASGAPTLFSDTFSTTTLDSRWRYYDPVGDVTLHMIGSNAIFEIPAGTSHDLWTGSSNKAPRLLQPAPDADFGVEIKFDTVPSKQYQIQGLVVQESDSKLIRMGTYHTGSALLAFAAFIDGGSSNVFLNTAPAGGITTNYMLRMQRAGNDWTFSHSVDGTTWTVATTFTQALAVAEVGFYAGNSGPNPQYFTSIDYFMDMANPVTDDDQVISSPFQTPLTTEVAETDLPETFSLQGNYPNPFNPTTKLLLDLPEDAEVTVEIFDLMGRKVMSVPPHRLAAGAGREVSIDGSRLSSGTYLYKATASMADRSGFKVGRMVLLK